MKVFLVSPAFHGYWRSYATALENLGYEVEPFVYQQFSSLGARLKNKLVYELPDALGTGRGAAAFARTVTRDAVEALEAAAPDVVLVIKGDVLEDAFWGALERRSLRTVLYLYDDLSYLRFTEGTLRRPQHIATFSARDHEQLCRSGHDASYLPLFFDTHLHYSTVHEDAVVFVGARYPDREAALTGLQLRGLPVVAYGREWSSRAVDRMRSWQLRRPPVPGRPDVTLAESVGIEAGGAAAYNSHFDHDGFNNRTFEISGAGGLQLIDRPDVDAFYEPGREILVYRSQRELEELAARALRDRAWGRAIRAAARARTLAEHTCEHRCRELAAHW